MSQVIRFPLPHSLPARPVAQRPCDESLLLRFRALGDYAAFDRLFRRHKGAFVSFLLRLSGNRAVAEHVSRRAWMRVVSTGAGADAGRHATFRTGLYALGCDLYASDYADAIADNLCAQPLPGTALWALMTLPLCEREILALWAGGFSARQIGDVTGEDPDHVVEHKRRALTHLATQLTGATAVRR